MANTATNVSAATPKVGGAIYTAPAGTTLPETANEALDEDFKSLGYVSEEGVVNNNSPEAGDDIPTWDGDSIPTGITGRPDTFAFTLLEAINVDVLKEIYGSANVSGTLSTGITVHAKAQDLPQHPWVIDMILRDNTLYRIVIPTANIVEIAERSFVKTGAIGYGVTIKAAPDSTGATHHEYIKGPSTTSGGESGGGTGEQT